jgi:crotonobetainyl-CoA:carnitine CoA-transferase CaiB-like acyl-CoA transferase
MSGTSMRVTAQAPCLGADTEEFMRALGYSDGEIDTLRESKILY